MELEDITKLIHIHVLNVGLFKRGASVFIPWVGIVVGRDFKANKDLIRHEFGHYLQLKKWGAWTFFRYVIKDSLLSCWRSQRKKYVWHRHSDTWTEWSANILSWKYFGCPDDWDTCRYPLQVNKTRKGVAFPNKIKHLEAEL